jgi:IMP dehydrogenase
VKIRKTKGLTFDDVLLVPKRSPIASRNDVDTSAWLTPGLCLRVPVISANMDTVTEADMAIAMARAGGIGIVHRFMTVDRQVQHVQRVKRSEGLIVENPYAIDQQASILDAKKQMEVFDIGGLVVTNGGTELIGLITQRDVLLAPDDSAPVNSVMTRPDHIVSVRPGISHEEARRVLHENRLEKLPVIDEKGRFVGLITAQDLIKQQQHPNATKDERGRLRVGAAIGVLTNEHDRAGALIEAGVDVLVLDIAHGHADHCIRMVKELKANYPQTPVVAGNVASGDGALELAQAGADAIKVGIGPGSICTTRVVTGFGVPQLTAIMDSVTGLREAGLDTPVIADGGIRTSGDMVKALAAGASIVMIGSLFAGCEEAPGAPVIRDGQKVKVVRGMASLGATISRKEREGVQDDESAESQKDWDKVVPEGVEAVVPYRGHVHEILYQMVGGLRSGLSYGGARNIRELQEKAEFIQITPAGIRESSHHDVRKI